MEQATYNDQELAAWAAGLNDEYLQRILAALNAERGSSSAGSADCEFPLQCGFAPLAATAGATLPSSMPEPSLHCSLQSSHQSYTP